MRVLLVYAHPVELSFNAALRDRIAASLSPRHEVDLLDLHAENFNPVMSRASGVSLHIQPDGRVRGGLTHLHKLGGVVTYGRTRWRARLMGDYPRKLVCRYLRHSIGMAKPVVFLAHYAMNVSTPDTRARFLAQVGRAMAGF